MDIENLTIKTAHKHLKNKDFSAVELAEAFFQNADKKNKEVNAYIEIFGDYKEQAGLADKVIAEGGKILPLTGIPLAIKDNILIEGKSATAGS
ncbi:MAG: Asp-tRNA(Asn)/Glu-tRNA(Gln) amidotransferase subunit GatA, partial [Candidatus Pacebacteria bacterium]|nr:Asp-tRNA(Asn)/Glu-tRNA(Gln) amidotransferase subunit GatA [Candidatus Paceibacterota bacterium]